MSRSPSIRMVADRAGVSTATVSNVLNGKDFVSPDYVRRVRSAVEELGYIADPNASRLRSGRHALAGVVVPDLTNAMFGAFVSTLERLARDDGYDLLVVSSANDAVQEAERLRAIRSWRPAGLIVIPCDGALAERLPPGAGPIVVADRIPDDAAFDLVAVDNARSAGTIAAHLAGQGYRSCLVAGTTLTISNVRERWDGALAAAGPIRFELLECGLDPQRARRLLRDRLRGRPRPEALFTLDHRTALIAYEELCALGIVVPDDLAFASFDETEWMRLVRPPMTAVAQPVDEMARTAWTQLMRRVAGTNSAPETMRLPCSIEIRASTLRPLREPDHAAA